MFWQKDRLTAVIVFLIAIVLAIPVRATDDPPAVKEFKARVQKFVALHKKIESKVDPLDKTANAAVLVKQKEQMAREIRSARAGAAEGDIFLAEVRPLLRDIIKKQLAGPEGAKARAMILGEGNPSAEGKAPVIKINASYPTSVPTSTVPPSLLQALPQLPEQLEYRFVGRTLILRDTAADLVVDLIADAVPATPTPEPKDVKTPLTANSGSLRFAVIGDTGTGGSDQYDVARQLEASWKRLPFNFVIMVGDNMYGSEATKDFSNKFERPYQTILQAGVKFYAALGNHDDAALQRAYKPFHMEGQRYYSFKPKNDIRFFALDSNYMDKEQLSWLEQELKGSGSDWKLLFFHHPVYSSGEKHGSNVELRSILEPLIIKYGVDVVFTGHEHFYERLRPQNGVQYFIIGSSAKLRKGNIAKTDLTAKGFDQDNVYFLAEISGDEMRFQTISRQGTLVDSGLLKRAEKRAAAGR